MATDIDKPNGKGQAAANTREVGRFAGDAPAASGSFCALALPILAGYRMSFRGPIGLPKA